MAVIGRLWRSYARFGVFQTFLLILTWNTFVEHFFVPGSVWAQYVCRSSALDLAQLQTHWSALFQQQINLSLQTKELFALEHLLPGHFTPIEIFYQHHTSKGERCFGRSAMMTDPSKWVSVVGPKGIIGHAHQKKNGFYTIIPIRNKGIRLSLTLAEREGVFLAQGDGRELVGLDREGVLSKGDQLVTLACDPYYPPFYPVAEVETVLFSEKEDSWVFHARPLQVIEHVSYGMLYHRAELETLDAS